MKISEIYKLNCMNRHDFSYIKTLKTERTQERDEITQESDNLEE